MPLAGGGIEALDTLPYREGSGDRRGGSAAIDPYRPPDQTLQFPSLTLGNGSISLVAARRSRR